MDSRVHAEGVRVKKRTCPLQFLRLTIFVVQSGAFGRLGPTPFLPEGLSGCCGKTQICGIKKPKNNRGHLPGADTGEQ